MCPVVRLFKVRTQQTNIIYELATKACYDMTSCHLCVDQKLAHEHTTKTTTDIQVAQKSVFLILKGKPEEQGLAGRLET